MKNSKTATSIGKLTPVQTWALLNNCLTGHTRCVTTDNLQAVVDAGYAAESVIANRDGVPDDANNDLDIMSPDTALDDAVKFADQLTMSMGMSVTARKILHELNGSLVRVLQERLGHLDQIRDAKNKIAAPAPPPKSLELIEIEQMTIAITNRIQTLAAKIAQPGCTWNDLLSLNISELMHNLTGRCNYLSDQEIPDYDSEKLIVTPINQADAAARWSEVDSLD